MDDEWEEEEQLVVVELSGIINNDFLSKCQKTCKILDIDSEKPLMQVGRYVFAGEYEDALGTCVLFEEEQGIEADNPELKYKCHTVKRLMMQRTFLTEKKAGETSPENIDIAMKSQCNQDASEGTNQQMKTKEQQEGKGKMDKSVGS